MSSWSPESIPQLDGCLPSDSELVGQSIALSNAWDCLSSREVFPLAVLASSDVYQPED